MNEDLRHSFDATVRRYEKQLGRRLSPEERAEIEMLAEKVIPELDRMMAKTARHQKTAKEPSFPDFEAIYERKAELDQKLLGDSDGFPPHDPRPKAPLVPLVAADAVRGNGRQRQSRLSWSIRAPSQAHAFLRRDG
jgi:hypothetical protein